MATPGHSDVYGYEGSNTPHIITMVIKDLIGDNVFKPGDKVRIIESVGEVVDNLWAINDQNMMVEVRFPNGTTSVFDEAELTKADDESNITIALDDLSSVFADSINAMASECHEIARDHGFWDDGDDEIRMGNRQFMMARVALMHSECSELLEEIRMAGNRRSQMEEECADILIRVFDFCGGYGLNLGEAVIQKMEKNRNRPHMHGKRA